MAFHDEQLHIFTFTSSSSHKFAIDLDPLHLLTLMDFFFLRLPSGQYGPVSQLSRSEEKLYRSI